MATKTLNARLITRNNTAANFASTNPVLLKGEMGFETDTQRFKFGNGVAAWNDLPYASGGKIIAVTASPIGSNWEYPVGTIWINTTTGISFILISTSPGVGVWKRFVEGSEVAGFGDMKKADFAAIDAAGGYVDKAKTADKLTTARTINGIAFDGSTNITILDATKEPAITSDTASKFWSGTKTWRDLATDVRAVVLTGLSVATNAVVAATDSILVAIGKLQAQITAHTGSTSNPHSVTKAQVGLGNVDNTADNAKNVLSATKLTTPRTIAATGDATAAAVSFDGTANVSLAMVLANVVAAGTGCKITVNAKGLVTGIAALTAEDIPALTSAKITDLGTAATRNIGTANGQVVVVGADGKIANSLIPALALTDVFEAATQAGMTGLSTAEQGDICVRSDINRTFILKQTPASVLSNWVELKTPTDTVLSVNGQTGAITLSTSNIAEGTNLYWTTARGTANFNANFATKSVTGLSDGANVLMDTDVLILNGGN